jgi:hypothetical protein
MQCISGLRVSQVLVPVVAFGEMRFEEQVMQSVWRGCLRDQEPVRRVATAAEARLTRQSPKRRGGRCRCGVSGTTGC